MADETIPEKPGPQPGEANKAAAPATTVVGQRASAPAAGANPPAVPHATATPPAARPAAPRPPAAPIPDLAGKTTNVASPGGAAARAAVGRPATAGAGAATRDPDDTSPLLTRRAWMGLAWGAFSAASVAALAATGRFMFPNVLNEPP